MSILKFNLKSLFILPLVVLFLSIVGYLQSHKLKVDMDLTGLLSGENKIVKEMNEVSSIVGGGGYLIVLIGPVDQPESYLKKVSNVIKDTENIKYSYFEKEAYKFKDKALLLMNNKDFKKLNLKVASIYGADVDTTGLGLFKNSNEELNKDFQEELGKLKKQSNQEQYFISEDKKNAMLLIKPTFASTDLELSEKLVSEIDKKISSLNIPYILSGRYVEKLTDKKQFDKDVQKTSVIASISLFIVLFLGLGSFRAGVFTLTGVFLAMGQTIGLAYYFVGSINILTGFLLAILSGLGSEYGIHLVRRYVSEMKKGLSKSDATERTYLIMGRTLFSAALTASAAFFILVISDFRGFSELGIIAGLGIICIYLTFMAIFPLGARFLPDFKEDNFKSKFAKIFYFYPFNQKYLKYFILLIPVLIYGLKESYFEFDFERLHNFSKETQKVNELTDSLYGRAITPSAVMVENREKIFDLEDFLLNKEIIDTVISYNTVMPEHLEFRYERIQELRSNLMKVSKKEIEDKSGMSFDEIDHYLKQEIYDDSYIPISLRENFGPEKNILLVFPKEKQGTYENISRYANVLNKSREQFKEVKVGSDTLVFHTILEHIIKDGKIVILLFLLGAFFVFLPDFKSFKIALSLELQLILGGIILISLMGLINEPFTILNVAVIPAVLASGIDMGVHQAHSEIELKSNALKAAKRISGPVHLGMIASLCGFGSLLFAEAKMLNGIGWLAILGQISMYLVSMIIFPLLKDFFYRQKSPHL